MKQLLFALLFAIPLLAGFPGCSVAPTSSTLTPQQSVFASKGAYEIALVAAVAYKGLPACATSQPPCSTPAVIAMLQHSQPAARSALDAAQLAVTTPGFGTDIVASAVASASAAMAAFKSITDTLPKK